MQISVVILLFSDQISRRGESFQGGADCLRGAPPRPRPPCGRKPEFLEVVLLKKITSLQLVTYH